MKQLTKRERKDIRILALKKRESFGTGSIGENIFKLVQDMDIQIVYDPIPFDVSRSNNFSGLYASFRNKDEQFRFIGLNTFEPLDKQLFILAHELYHHWEESDMKVCRNLDDPHDECERKANVFAAEFLLPSSKLEEEVLKATTSSDHLKDVDYKRLLRFIAQLHCAYGLPYKAIVRSLKDMDAIGDEQYEQLWQEPYRDPNSTYFHIGKNINEQVFVRLNSPTFIDGADGGQLYESVGAYEKDVISLSELAKDLELFGNGLDDFGLGEEVSEDNIVDWESLLEEKDDE